MAPYQKIVKKRYPKNQFFSTRTRPNPKEEDIFVLVYKKYPENFTVIAQKLYEDIGFPVRFSGQAIENRARTTISLQR